MIKSRLMSRVSVYIIAYNEARKLVPALKSVQWADEIIVADSYSTDDTVKVAEEHGARVVQIPFEGFGKLRNDALKACTHEWIFSLDSDERCTEEARDEILEIVKKSDSKGPSVWFMPRRNWFLGRWIRHSGFYPDYRQPQLFRKSSMQYLEEQVHEGFEVLDGSTPAYLKHPIWQIPYLNLEEFQHKANRYSTLSAIKMQERGKTATLGSAFLHACASFFKFYIAKRGFLDGWAGLVIALGNFEGTFYKYAKLCERRADWQEPDSLK